MAHVRMLFASMCRWDGPLGLHILGQSQKPLHRLPVASTVAAAHQSYRPQTCIDNQVIIGVNGESPDVTFEDFLP